VVLDEVVLEEVARVVAVADRPLQLPSRIDAPASPPPSN
jgi:hypothetical protein